MKILRFTFVVLFLFTACTYNPFFADDEIKDNSKFKISGQVRLDETDDFSGVSIYLEQLDLYTETDKRGNFELNLQLSPKLQVGSKFTGFLHLYYYVNNYELKTSTIFMKDGEFGYGMADLDQQGIVKDDVLLGKLLDVKTTITPNKIKSDYTGQVQIQVRLENRADSVVVFTHFAKEKKLGSAFLKGKEAQFDYIHLISQPSNLVATVIDSVKYWTMDINWEVESNEVDIGKYEAIPYLFVYQENIPDRLLFKYGKSASVFSKDFINMPFRRKTADFEIAPKSD